LLKTAQAIAHLASRQDERDFSGKLVKLADHELDIAFSIALREAAEHPVAVTPEAKELMARLKKSEAQVKTDEGQVELFRAQIRKVSGPRSRLSNSSWKYSKPNSL